MAQDLAFLQLALEPNENKSCLAGLIKRCHLPAFSNNVEQRYPTVTLANETLAADNAELSCRHFFCQFSGLNRTVQFVHKGLKWGPMVIEGW